MIDFENPPGANQFLAVRELKIHGRRTPPYNRRANLVFIDKITCARIHQ